MIKKLFISFLLISFIGYGIMKLLSKSNHVTWGHHFIFENELKMSVDSLEISIGVNKTIIRATKDSKITSEGNISVPDIGYPHNVTFKIYTNEKSFLLKADSFNCYNCDGSHMYKLKKTGAEYYFLN